jgi:hypothetical protein
MGWTVQGSNTGGGDVYRTCPYRPWGPSSLLYNGYLVFPGGKERPGRGVDHPPPSSAEVKENRAILLLSLRALLACYRVTFTSHCPFSVPFLYLSLSLQCPISVPLIVPSVSHFCLPVLYYIASRWFFRCDFLVVFSNK